MTSPNTAIAWTDATWNPTTGCSKVSEGCRNCYANAIADRLWKDRKFTDVQCHEDRLDQPLRWRDPRRIFVNSMSDLFHEKVPFEFVDRVFAVMALAPRHTFQVLTKRPERMRQYFAEPAVLQGSEKTFAREEAVRIRLTSSHAPKGLFAARIPWPLPNVWLGVSCEDQAAASKRIPLLLDTPAAVRFVSAEPLLAPLDLRRWLSPRLPGDEPHWRRSVDTPFGPRDGLDWVIVGGESGPAHRAMDLAWARELREQCRAAEVAFFMKQVSASRAGQGIDALGEVVQEFPA